MVNDIVFSGNRTNYFKLFLTSNNQTKQRYIDILLSHNISTIINGKSFNSQELMFNDAYFKDLTIYKYIYKEGYSFNLKR